MDAINRQSSMFQDLQESLLDIGSRFSHKISEDGWISLQNLAIGDKNRGM